MSDNQISPEIQAMQKIEQMLEPLPDEVKYRVLKWANDRFMRTGKQNIINPSDEGATISNSIELADLFSKSMPRTQEDMVLVVAYWFQFIKNEKDLDAQNINNELKNLGNPISNITRVLESLKAKKPARIMQTKKSGSSQQARKKYKVTLEGKRAVEEMVTYHHEEVAET
jgi:hypothetical protein